MDPEGSGGTMATTYHIAIKDSRGEWIRREVDEDTYTYIRQLESYIQYPTHSKLKEVYPDRFKRGQ